IVGSINDNDSSARRLGHEIAVWYVKCLPVGQVNRKRPKGVRIAHCPYLLSGHDSYLPAFSANHRYTTFSGSAPSVTIVKSLAGARSRWARMVRGVRPSIAAWISSVV